MTLRVGAPPALLLFTRWASLAATPGEPDAARETTIRHLRNRSGRRSSRKACGRWSACGRSNLAAVLSPSQALRSGFRSLGMARQLVQPPYRGCHAVT
jgi:hypothetical protein